MEYVVWGSHPAYAGGVPIKLTGGTLAWCRREVKFRERIPLWTNLTIRAKG